MAYSGRVIVLKGDPIVKEAKAGAAGILPGHRLDLDAAGDVVVGGAGAATDGQRKAFAVEADVIGNDATTAYVDNEQVKYVVAGAGDEILVRAVATLTWAIGDALFAAASGRVTDVAGTAVAPIGYALSANAAGAVDSLHPMEVA